MLTIIEKPDEEDRLLFSRYMLGFDSTNRAGSEKYKCYVILMAVIRELLNECKINISSYGYMYIQDCIIAIFDLRSMNINFKKDVYPCVALKNGVKDPANIEHSIRNALVAAYKVNTSDPYHSSAIMNSFDKRPTNKEFLLYMTREVYRRLWHESVEFARF
jgi:hypothetical protein